MPHVKRESDRCSCVATMFVNDVGYANFRRFDISRQAIDVDDLRPLQTTGTPCPANSMVDTNGGPPDQRLVEGGGHTCHPQGAPTEPVIPGARIMGDKVRTMRVSA